MNKSIRTKKPAHVPTEVGVPMQESTSVKGPSKAQVALFGVAMLVAASAFAQYRTTYFCPELCTAGEVRRQEFADTFMDATSATLQIGEARLMEEQSILDNMSLCITQQQSEGDMEKCYATAKAELNKVAAAHEKDSVQASEPRVNEAN